MMKEYLVSYEIEDEIIFAKETEIQVFGRMWDDDCYQIKILGIWYLKPNGKIQRAQFYGTWHNTKDPLRMEIRTGKKVLSAGYGRNH